MAKRQREASRNSRDEAQPSYPNIPEEIILQILQRLPLNSLSRFTCVSKKWLSLISEISVTKRGREMVIFLEKPHGERVYESKESTHKHQAIYGSCNGLLLMGLDDDFFWWNPLTSYFKKVLHFESLCGKHVVSGLCYDFSTDEYKVVMVLDHAKSVVVGSFKNKSWMHVECSFSSNMMLFFYSGPTLNECLHWSVTCVSKINFKSEYSQILYFDPQPGTFKKVPMPQPKQSGGDVIRNLGVLDRCLCMSRSKNPSDGECNYIEVLVMKEYGVANSWSLMFVVSNLMPFGYSMKFGETLALELPSREKTTRVYNISVYNPMKKSTTGIPIPTPCPKYYFCRTDTRTYEESLIKPPDYNWEEEELRQEATYTEYFLDGSHKKWKQETCLDAREEGSGWTDSEDLGRCKVPY